MDTPKVPTRPPFANYDIVVYFGCGLFALPFIDHYYLEPFGVKIAALQPVTTASFSQAATSTLLLLFSVYVLGHILAFISSQFIEKPMEGIFGKTSSIIYKTSKAPPSEIAPLIIHQIKASLRESTKQSTYSSTIARLIIHLPMIAVYLLAYHLRIFGFYISRIPPQVFRAVERNVSKIGLEDIEIHENSPWFKVIESYVVNNYPTPSARRYNNRVISGFFRSICIIFLAAIWCEILYALGSIFSDSRAVATFMDASIQLPSAPVRIGALMAIYCFALYAYLKYQRRCVEEAILGFALTRIE